MHRSNIHLCLLKWGIRVGRKINYYYFTCDEGFRFRLKPQRRGISRDIPPPESNGEGCQWYYAVCIISVGHCESTVAFQCSKIFELFLNK